MALSQPISIYGIYSMTPYSRTDGLPYGILFVLGGANLELTAEQEQLYGGANKYPWAVEAKTIKTQFTANVKSYESFLFDLFLGSTSVVVASEAAGNSTGFANVKGTSVFKATTGIATVTVTTAADAKFSKYWIKAVTGTTVDVYGASDIDFLTGTDLIYVNDTLKITSAPLTVPNTGGTVVVPSTGLTLTGGSGTVAMTVGDSAEVYIRPIGSGGVVSTFGATQTVFPEFGCILLAQKKSNFEMFEIELYRCVGSGLPINLQEKSFSVSDLTVTALYDSSRALVGQIRRVVGLQ